MDKALQIQEQVINLLGTDEVYLVGGSVRDVVMGNSPKDYDFCTPMLPDDMEAALKKGGRRVYGIGKKFGTIGFKVPFLIAALPKEDGEQKYLYEYEYVEVTTFRSEVYTNKSRKPEVKFVPSLKEDLARRDFTMNAMVLRPDGTIFDPYGGRLDMHVKQIKTVGMPKDRIMEDPLRMLRAARFAARYGYSIDANFIGKARHFADRIYDVSVERWVQELDKLITAEHWSLGLTDLFQMELLYRILPEITSLSSVVNAIPEMSKDADTAWQQLLWQINDNPHIARYVNSGICQRLKFSNTRTNGIIKGDIL